MIQGRPITERTSTATCPLCRHRRLTLHLKRPNSGQCQSLEFFLGYRLEPGGQWKGDYYVADLEHFRNGFSRPSVHQVKRIWRNPEEGYVFPMLAAYERLTREVQLLDTGEGKGLPKADAPTEPDVQLNAVGPGSDHPNDVLWTLKHLLMFPRGTTGCVMKSLNPAQTSCRC